MPHTIAFDVYGTLVDPVEMGKHLETFLGDHAKAFGKLWHEKKVEYAFRRGLMHQYQNFEVCTSQALQYCLKTFEIEMSKDSQQQLIAKFGHLVAFPDVIPGLTTLKEEGHLLVAFSNGTQSSLRTLLTNSKILPQLDEVISVNDVSSFKPDPRVYEHLLAHTKTKPEDCWMISSNPWDVIGGKAAGLRAAWVQRDSGTIFDPWEFQPDLVVGDLVALSKYFQTNKGETPLNG